LEFHYDGAELAAEAMERLAGSFVVLLKAAVEDPERSVGELPLLGEEERARLVMEWNRTEAWYPRQCIQELIEHQAGCTPEREAVRCGADGLTYGELNERANRLAHFLRRSGAGAGTLVGLCAERSVEMVVAVLGILKSGGAYVPLSAEHPKPRLTSQLAGVEVLLSEGKWRAHLPQFGGLALWLDEDQAKWAEEPMTNPEVVTTPEDLAYVMYTSGSTGEPKGVEIRHSSLVNYTWFMSRQLKLEQEPKGLQFAMVSTLAADLGNTCLYPALISGGCLHVLPYAVATDAQRMASYQEQYGMDVLKIVPSHLSALLHSEEGSRVLPKRYLITGGEVLTRTLVEEVEGSGATCLMINHYGPTETTIGSLMLPLSEYDRKRSKRTIPIGRPIANTQVYVLDELGSPCPIGVCGELHIGGVGVARGYLKRAELTAEKFMVDGFSNRSGGRLYKTGDLVRYQPDGQIEFLGRVDDQVKIRGYRIEPGEIESVLLRQTEVKQAVVLAREDERQEKRLIAYVVVRNQPAVSEAELQQKIREQLPDYMVPHAVVLMDKLPLTSNGKVDRQALPKPEDVAGKKRTNQPPTTSTEQMVAQIWSEVLKVTHLGVHDDFFQLGGHSLLATQVISRIREQFGVGIALRSLFETPRLGSFAAVVDAVKGTNHPVDVPIQRVSREAYRKAQAVAQQ
jgi:amino acid adenylation domain-containing protein